jgi:hypothetical protein
VPTDTAGEYQRKVRISSGNFQNLFFFKKLLIAFWRPIGFTFWSHKVLRWLTPFFLLISLICSAILINYRQIFILLFAVQMIGFMLPLIDHFVSFRNKKLKFISHFYLMNFALLQGFVKFTQGIKSSVWQPVKRNV